MQILQTLGDLEAAIQRSQDHPVVIFKHSATCGTSAMAFEEIEDLVAGEPAAEVLMVSVNYPAVVSKEIAARFGVRHQSPQAIILSKGAVMWHGSHFHVNRDEITTALAKVAVSPV